MANDKVKVNPGESCNFSCICARKWNISRPRNWLSTSGRGRFSTPAAAAAAADLYGYSFRPPPTSVWSFERRTERPHGIHFLHTWWRRNNIRMSQFIPYWTKNVVKEFVIKTATHEPLTTTRRENGECYVCFLIIKLWNVHNRSGKLIVFTCTGVNWRNPRINDHQTCHQLLQAYS